MCLWLDTQSTYSDLCVFSCVKSVKENIWSPHMKPHTLRQRSHAKKMPKSKTQNLKISLLHKMKAFSHSIRNAHTYSPLSHKNEEEHTHSVMQKYTCTQGNHAIPLSDLMWQSTFIIAALKATIWINVTEL